MAGILGFAVPVRALSMEAAADSCGPAFAAVYDFGIGDVFERSRVHWEGVSNGQASWKSEVIRKYTVVAAQTSGDRRTYDISGVEVHIRTLGPDTLSRSANAFQDRLEYTDSASHFLNQCKDAKVPADTSGRDELGLETRIQVIRKTPWGEGCGPRRRTGHRPVGLKPLS